MIRTMSQLIKDPKFAHVAVAYEKAEPTDQEVCALIDDVIAQTFGPKGLAALVKPGDRVTIKTNIGKKKEYKLKIKGTVTPMK